MFSQDLRFIREEMVQDPANLGDAIGAAERAKYFADLAYFKAQMLGEQMQWSNYIASSQAWEDSATSDLAKHREQALEALEAAVKGHSEAFYITACLNDRKDAQTFMESALRRFSESPPIRQSQDILRVNVYNLAASSSDSNARTGLDLSFCDLTLLSFCRACAAH
jgi:hypothetical protein